MLKLRKATIEDVEKYFNWVNDPVVREQSYDSSIIDLESHKRWFDSALKDDTFFMYIGQNEIGEDIGQVRIQKQEEKNNNEALVSISIDSNHRGKGYAKEILMLSTDFFLKFNRGFLINAYIKEANLSSKFAFEKAGFTFNGMIEFEYVRSFHFVKK
jgi:RimJ/RimL family protein N-acetyltransferase